MCSYCCVGLSHYLLFVYTLQLSKYHVSVFKYFWKKIYILFIYVAIYDQKWETYLPEPANNTLTPGASSRVLHPALTQSIVYTFLFWIFGEENEKKKTSACQSQPQSWGGQQGPAPSTPPSALHTRCAGTGAPQAAGTCLEPLAGPCGQLPLSQSACSTVRKIGRVRWVQS